MASLLIIEDNLELANLLSSVAEMRGHHARVALTGADALAALGQAKHDAAVVDLSLPDMPGSEVLLALQEAKVPAWVMSGVYKTDQYATEAVETYGAVAFFRKPFPILELLKAIEARTGAVTPKAKESSTAAAMPTVAVPEPQTELMAPTLTPLEAWERAWNRGSTTPTAIPTFERSGSLGAGATSVPKLLNAAYQARLSGELVLHREPAIKALTIEEGIAVYAASNLAHERFARFCARRGLLPSEDLEAVASLAKEQGLKTGDAMVKLGLLDEQQRRTMLEEQVKEIIWSTFAWRDGDYAFALNKPLREDAVTITVFPGQLIIDGCLRLPLVELRHQLNAAVHLYPVAEPPYPLEMLRLTGEQAMLLAHADGSKSVEDLIALTDLPEREALGLFVGLSQAGILEPRAPEQPKRRRDSYGLLP